MNVNAAPNHHNYFNKGPWQYVMNKAGPKALKNDSTLGLESIKSRIFQSSNPPEPDTSLVLTTPATTSKTGPSKSADSIGNEMTHFKPIRMMPISGQYNADKELITPIVRYTEVKSKKAPIIFAPAKSKFKPELPLKVRNSAFCLVPKTASATATTAIKPLTNKRTTRNSQLKATATCVAIPEPITKTTTTPSSYSVYNRNKSKQKLMCSLPTKLPKSEKNLLQVQNDYALAILLQEYDDNDVGVSSCQPTNGRCHDTSTLNATLVPNSASNTETDEPDATATANHISSIAVDISKTRRYFLRSRSKPQTIVSTPTTTIKLNGTVNRKSTATNGTKSRTKPTVLNGRVEKCVGGVYNRRKPKSQ